LVEKRRLRALSSSVRLAGLEDLKVTIGVAVVLPFLIQDHVQTFANRVFARRVARGVWRDAHTLQLPPGERGNRLPDLSHAFTTSFDDIVERWSSAGIDAQAGGISEPRTGEAPRVIRVSIPLTIRRSQQSLAMSRWRRVSTKLHSSSIRS